MIPLSLVLVVASAVTLGFGVFATSDPLVWVSLAAGLGAVASVTGSVLRHRRVPAAVPDADPAPAGAATVGSASPGSVPAPSPTPSRSAAPGWGHAWTPGPPAVGGWTGAVPVSPADGPEPSRTAPGGPPEHSGRSTPPGSPSAPLEDGVEDVPVRDALRVAQLADEVLVVDGQRRYHLADCATLDDEGPDPVPLPVSVARRGGFVPCAVCTPDRVLLDRLHARSAERTSDGR